MGLLNAKRRLAVYVALLGGGVAVCGWQAQEHLRFKRNAQQALVNRGRDISDTLSVVIRSQRRGGPGPFGQFVARERLEPALRDLIRANDIAAIAIISASGDEVARAGRKVELTPAEILQGGGAVWGEGAVTLMTLSDWNSGEEGARQRGPVIVAPDPQSRGPRFPLRGPPPSEPPASSEPTANAGLDSSAPTTAATSPPAPGPGRGPEWPRIPFGRRMTPEEWEETQAALKRQGVQSIVISLPTGEMQRAVQADLLLRSLVSLLAMGGAIVASLAWRNVGKTAELQIRLVKAGEMNTHLKEMNLAAAGLAHETRNPLNLIRGLAQMIAMQAREAPKLKEHAATIVEEADRVTVQLNEFIHYSKPREAHFAPVEVMRLVADVARTLIPDLEEKHLELTQVPSSLRIEADEQLLRQALFNVLLNATQAVAPGGRIEVRLTPTGAREAVLEIADDGPGVPEAERASIFKPYVTMRPKGVGLGLAIVAQIAAAHHWEVACVANEPRGARFRFSHLRVVGASA